MNLSLKKGVLCLKKPHRAPVDKEVWRPGQAFSPGGLMTNRRSHVVGTPPLGPWPCHQRGVWTEGVGTSLGEVTEPGVCGVAIQSWAFWSPQPAVSFAVWRDSPSRGSSLRPRRRGSATLQLWLQSQFPGQGGSWWLLSSLPSALCMGVQADSDTAQSSEF